MKRTAAFLATFLILALLGNPATPGTGASEHRLEVTEQLQAPFKSVADLPSALEEFEARDMRGRMWRDSELRGKVVLLDFWATWCSPCLAEFPFQRRAYKKFKERGFEILAISIDAGQRRDLERAIRRYALTWPQIQDGNGYQGRLASSFGVQLLPASILIDRDGRIVAVNLRGQDFETRLESMFPEG